MDLLALALPAFVIPALAEPPTPGTGFATVERGLELTGLFAFAVSGAMLAVRKQFELVGIIALAMVTALGGGIARDLVLSDSPPLAFEDVWYLVVPLGASAMVFAGHALIERSLTRSVLVFDAIGSGCSRSPER